MIPTQVSHEDLELITTPTGTGKYQHTFIYQTYRFYLYSNQKEVTQRERKHVARKMTERISKLTPAERMWPSREQITKLKEAKAVLDCGHPHNVEIVDGREDLGIALLVCVDCGQYFERVIRSIPRDEVETWDAERRADAWET